MAKQFTPGTRLNNYTIERKLGAGGMGEVYLAKDERLNRKVAIKTLNLDPEEYIDNVDLLRRFLSEAQTIAQLNSPSISTIYYISDHSEEIPYMVMEYLDGHDLKEYSISNSISVDFIIELITQVARALALVHDKDIIHRDIKPANIFYTNKRQFKIIDFGIAKWFNEQNNFQTQTGQFVGSLAFSAPENFKSQGIDHRIDIYSLGLSIFTLIIGHVPFEAKTTFEMLDQIQNDEPKIPKELREKFPEDLISLLNEMVEKDPNDRPNSMHEVLERVQTIAQENKNTVTVQMKMPKNKKSKLPLIIKGVILFSIAFFGIFLYRNRLPHMTGQHPKDLSVQSVELNKMSKTIHGLNESADKEEMLKLLNDVDKNMNQLFKKTYIKANKTDLYTQYTYKIAKTEQDIRNGKFQIAKKKLNLLNLNIQTKLEKCQ